MLDNNDNSQFEFDEIVEIIARSPEYTRVEGKKGIISGKVRNEKGFWYYSVDVENDFTCCFMGDQLKSTGKFIIPEESNILDTIKVTVNENGKGYSKEYPNLKMLDDEEE